MQFAKKRNLLISFGVFLCAAVQLCDTALAQSTNDEGDRLPLSPALAEMPGAVIHSNVSVRTTVRWQERDYLFAEGTSVLLEVIVDQGSRPSVRAEALRTLRHVPNLHLYIDDVIRDQLMELYDDLNNPKEKIDLIIIVAVRSPHALPFVARILENERDKSVRQIAAGVLAGWNVRRGVAGLVEILEECRDEGFPWADRTACNEAAKLLMFLNPRKGWGFPEEEIRNSIAESGDLDDYGKGALFIDEIKKWWVGIEHRFPDWKPGDPLPEIEDNKESEPGDDEQK